jgi:hypothetical protein
VLLSITNYYLLNYIKSRNLSATATVESKKHLYISITFAVSYLYKGVYNTFLAAYPSQMEDFEDTQPVLWSFIFFGLMFLGELFPLALLFNYQIRRNLHRMRRHTTVAGRLSRGEPSQYDALSSSGNEVDPAQDCIYEVEEDNGGASTGDYEARTTMPGK